MFSIDEMTAVKIHDINPRTESHGKELLPAADIEIVMKSSNHILSEFDGHLLGMLYTTADDDGGDQPELDGIDPVSEFPLLVTSAIKMPLTLTNEYAGYELTIDRGLGTRASNIVVENCAVNKIRLHCNEGGTVEVALRVQASKLTEGTIGRLCMLIGSETQITLTPPDVGQGAL